MVINAGIVVLVGGGLVEDPDLLTEVIDLGMPRKVAIVPMASAYEQPEQVVVAAVTALEGRDVEIEGVMALTRTEANLTELAGRIDDAECALLTDGSALHLRTTLKDTELFTRLMALVERGGLLVACGESATVVCDPMVDPRGGAPTVGLGPVRGFTVIPHVGDDPDDLHLEKLRRTTELSASTHPVVALSPNVALVCRSDGTTSTLGHGPVTVYRGGDVDPLGVAGLPDWR